MIPLIEPKLDGNESRYLSECIDTGYVSSIGPFVERFEKAFAATVGAKHAVACVSGTAALHVALRLAGARRGSMVAVSDFTFIASANAAAYSGADLLLIDSEPRTWNMDTEMLRDEVFRRAELGLRIPDVVEVVHVLGHPADIEPLLELRDVFGTRIVEDAAESLGASWTAGKQVGTVGDLGCFSFNGNKVITTGGGGMIVTDDVAHADAARHLTTQAKGPGGSYFHDTIGYNYRLTNLAAALGVAQIESLSNLLFAKRAIAERYTAWLEGLPVQGPPNAAWASPSYWIYSLLLDPGTIDPGDAVSGLMRRGVEARRLWPPLHLQQPYSGTDRLGGPVALGLYKRGLSLPSSAQLEEHEQQAVVVALGAML